jgi:hypothetical protein
VADGASYIDEIKKELDKGRRQWKRGDKIRGAFGYTRRRQTAIDAINAELAKRSIVATPTITRRCLFKAMWPSRWQPGPHL